jgi:hypothetical protein
MNTEISLLVSSKSTSGHMCNFLKILFIVESHRYLFVCLVRCLAVLKSRIKLYSPPFSLTPLGDHICGAAFNFVLKDGRSGRERKTFVV